jgi:Right handed beta helix region
MPFSRPTITRSTAGRRLRRAIVPGALAVLLAAAWAQPAAAATRYVRGAAEFEQAVSAFRSGGRIVLLPHLYRRPLVVGPRSRGMLRIVGMRGARVQELDVDHSRWVSIEHLTIAPISADATLMLSRSANILLERINFTAAGTTHTVALQLGGSTHVTVRSSSFSHCGDRSPEWSLCLRPDWATHVLIEDNRFHDCLGCDFIHGRMGRDWTVRDNRFARALACRSARVKCFHQDLMELFAADGLVISRNQFGVSQRGGAQVYLSGPVDHVRITNNVFLRSDPRAPGVHSPTGIVVGAAISPRLPHDVEIVNNTILSGWKLAKHAASSIVLGPHYDLLKPGNRPLIANNVLARLDVTALVCPRVRRSVRNVVIEGEACSPSDVVGDPQIGSDGEPTAASTLLIDRAYAPLAPPYDFAGRPRGSKPDIGAYEYAIR